MTDLEQRLSASLEGRYSVEGLLGQGGMALVFRALDVKHGRSVAVKVLRPDVASSLGSERFLSEIQICAGLSHPHILPLYDSGEADGLLFYVMPYIEGESLRQRLQRERQLALEEALHIARGSASALAYAHGRGIVHRDIKPENILLSAGEPVVADFGIAKAITAAGTEGTTRTTGGVAVGTPTYMSPEQASGESEIDGRADIYSLGCVLFEMLTGSPPYEGPTAMAITARKLVEPVPRLSLVRETIPPALERVVVKALAKVPADRFATAWDFAQALGTSGGGVVEAPAAAAARPREAAAPPHSVAVLPFANLSSDPEDEFLSDGIAEELIHALSKVEGLHVVARTSAFAFKGKEEDLRTIGRRLNVGTLLEGSVRKAARRVRVTTRLVGVEDGFELWSERYDGTLDDVFAFEDEIARATVEKLRVALLGTPEAAEAPTANSKAYEWYLRGRHAWNRRTEEGLNQSVDYLSRAIAEDPDFALAHAGLADSYVMLGVYGVRAPDEVMPQAAAAAEHALALKPELGEAHTALGCVHALYRWDWDAAERAFRRAVELNPRYPTARHWFAINCLAPRGRLDDALAQLRLAHERDPLSPTVNVSIGLLAYFGRDYRTAAACYRDVLAADPGFGMAHYFWGEAHEAEGRITESVASFRKAAELVGYTPETTAGLARASALAADAATADRLLAELTAAAASRFVSPVALAHVHIGLGATDEAFRWLERAVDQHDAELVWLGVRPAFDPLRSDPRFTQLLSRVNLAR